jgi:uncharacterized alpha-E superfamily protein
MAALMRQAPSVAPVAVADADAARQGREQDLVMLISEETRTGSLAQTLSALLFNARSVRDRLSVDTWRVVNDIDAELRSLRYLTTARLGDALDEMDNLVRAFSAFAGLTQENVTRGRGWLFLDTGRRIERALLTCGLLDVLLVPTARSDAESPVLEAVLATVDSLMSYRRRYRQGLAVDNLLELIVCNERNPRSLVWQLSRIEEHVGELPAERDEGLRSEPGRLALEAATLARLADVRRLAEPSVDAGQRELLSQLMGVLVARLRALSDALTLTYFRTAEEPHQLLRQRSGDRG